MSRKAIAAAVFLFVLGGCTGGMEKESPQKTLSEYVSRTFGLKSPADLAPLKGLTTGTARQDLDKLEKNEDLFHKTFVDEKNEFVSLKIRDERNLADGRVSVTYEITYVNRNPEAKVEDADGNEQVKAAASDKITVKKHAIFVLENGKWLVSEVQNLKTFVDHGDEEKISAQAKPASAPAQ
jgi:hypothetical protein